MGTALNQNTGFSISPSPVTIESGSLWAWGQNNFGQLGNQTVTYYSSPIQIGSLTNWSVISAPNSNYAFAGIKTDGTLWTWGWGYKGQLGNGTTVSYSSPIQIGSLTNWSKVSLGRFVAAIKTDGSLWVWGDNSYGQLGNGTIIDYSSPIQVGSLTNWSQVSCGEAHLMAIKTDGSLWGIGLNGTNSYGSLGIPATVNYSSPIQIGSLTNWSKVSCGNYFTMAIKTDGTLWGWGFNLDGELGNGRNFNYYSSPIQVGSLTNWSNVSCGDQHTLAIKTDGSLWVWGRGDSGELGNGTIASYSSPIQIGSLTNWKTVDGGLFCSLAIKTDGTLWVWGDNGFGQLGNGIPFSYSSPIQIGSLTNWGSIAVGRSSYAIPSSTQNYTPGQQTYYAGSLWNIGGSPDLSGSYAATSPSQLGGLNNWSQVSIGNSIAAVKTDGTLWIMGDNTFGQLGNGTTTNYSSPIQIGTATNWSQVSASVYTTSAIKTDGTLWGWGYNIYGQLGNGSIAYYSSPVQIGSLTNWKQVSCGYSGVTAAIKTNGTLWTWGSNSNGQLGNGNSINYSSPIQIGSLTNWSQVSCGGNILMAIKTDGTLWGWGYNNIGQLGNGVVGVYSSPVQIGTLTNWSQVSVSNYNTAGVTAAVRTDGTLWAWGYNYYGSLGNGTTINYSSPVQIGALTNWKQVSVGGQLTVEAVKTDGTLWGWGLNTSYQIGNGTNINYSSPIQVGSLNVWDQVVTGGWSISATYAISKSQTVYPTQDLGQRYVSKDYLIDVYPNIASATGARTTPGLWTWGRNISGELGNGTMVVNYSSPIQVGLLTNWKQVSAGSYHTVAIKTDGTLWACGDNSTGQLGDNTVTARTFPTQIGVLTNWKQVATSASNTLAIKTDGTLWGWGLNNYGQVGNGRLNITYSSPVQIGALTNWKQVSSFYRHALALKTDGTLWSWGENNYGALGDGTTLVASTPIQVGLLNDWKQVSAGLQCSAAIKTNGTLWAWGYNNYGGLGNGSTVVGYSSPVQIGSLTNWKQISIGYTSFGIKTDGTLWGWGLSDKGQLGNGTTAYIYSSPIQIGSLTNWKQVSGGQYHMVALKTDGTLWGCGYGGYGQLGNNDYLNYSSPIQIGALTKWKQISSGTNYVTSIADGYY